MQCALGSSIGRPGVHSLTMSCTDHQGVVRNMVGNQQWWPGTEGTREGGGRGPDWP